MQFVGILKVVPSQWLVWCPKKLEKVRMDWPSIWNSWSQFQRSVGELFVPRNQGKKGWILHLKFFWDIVQTFWYKQISSFCHYFFFSILVGQNVSYEILLYQKITFLYFYLHTYFLLYPISWFLSITSIESFWILKFLVHFYLWANTDFTFSLDLDSTNLNKHG